MSAQSLMAVAANEHDSRTKSSDSSVKTANSSRIRPGGRIGGVVGTVHQPSRTALADSLGHGVQLLGDATRLVVEWDCCSFREQQISTVEEWQSIVSSGCLDEVNGAYVLAWQKDDGSLVLARDPVGERTLYYAVLPQCILFASTVRALLATGLVSPELDFTAVALYLSCAYIPGPETLVRTIREVRPAETITFRAGVAAYDRHWHLPSDPGAWAGEDALRQSLRRQLESAVQERLPAHESVGAFLSGGLDSSLVVALAAKLHHAPIKTFSLSFGAGYPNELQYSSLVARHCRTEHRIIELSPRAVLENLDQTIGALNDPIGDPLTVPNFLLFHEASADVGIILNGEGGDPCFGGPKNLPMLLAELFGGAGDATREASYLRAHLKCYDELRDMLEPNVYAEIEAHPLEQRLTPHFADRRWGSFITKLQAMNVTFKGGHHILPKVDALSFPSGVLPRSPLFDRRVVELAFAIPPQLKLHGSVEKHLLKQAVRDLLPPEILERPKSGMLVPVEGWFQGPLLPYARERILDGLAPYRLIRPSYTEALLSAKLGGPRPRHGAKIWLLLTLEAWLRNVFSAAEGASQ